VSEQPAPAYHVVVFREGREPAYQTYADRAGLQKYLVGLRPGRGPGHVQAYVFFGRRLSTTKPPFSYLLEEGQEPLPLFEPPSPQEVDEKGALTQAPAAPAEDEYAAATQEGLTGHHHDLGQLEGKAAKDDKEEPLAPEGQP